MYRRLTSIILLFIFIPVFITGCAINAYGNIAFEQQGFYMGTIITEKVYGSKAQLAADEVMKRMKEIEKSMTINAPGSETDKLNDSAGKGKVQLKPDVIYVLEKAKNYARLSEGTFDVTVGPLVKAWGIFTDHYRVPGKEEIDSLKSLVNHKDLDVDVKTNMAGLAREGQVVDLGGIAKGYAGDEAINIYKKHGIKSAFVNLGGNVAALGYKPDGKKWSVGVQNPRAENGKIIGILHISDKAVVSSGDYERYFMKDNIRYHHILDPRTGYPSDSGLIGTTIVADSSIKADALSTSTFILGLDKGMQLVESLKGVEAVFVTKDKKVYTTSGIKDSFVFDDESREYTYVQER